MDPFEMYIDQVFLARLEAAKAIVGEKKKDLPEKNTDQLPFDVNKTMSYIKQENYLRERKKAKAKA